MQKLFFLFFIFLSTILNASAEDKSFDRSGKLSAPLVAPKKSARSSPDNSQIQPNKRAVPAATCLQKDKTVVRPDMRPDIIITDADLRHGSQCDGLLWKIKIQNAGENALPCHFRIHVCDKTKYWRCRMDKTIPIPPGTHWMPLSFCWHLLDDIESKIVIRNNAGEIVYQANRPVPGVSLDILPPDVQRFTCTVTINSYNLMLCDAKLCVEKRLIHNCIPNPGPWHNAGIKDNLSIPVGQSTYRFELTPQYSKEEEIRVRLFAKRSAGCSGGFGGVPPGSEMFQLAEKMAVVTIGDEMSDQGLDMMDDGNNAADDGPPSEDDPVPIPKGGSFHF